MVKLEFINSSAPRVKFHISRGALDMKILYSETKSIFSNGGNNLRVNTPRTLLERIWKENNESEVFIRLINNEIEFLLCE